MEQTAPETRQTRTCRNCGHDAIEKFCARCGQENTHHVLPLGDVLRDLLDEFAKFDSRLLVTLKPLLTRPGFLTNEFLAGRRAGYIAPLRLYFMISTVYFLAFSYRAAGQIQHAFENPKPISLSAPATLPFASPVRPTPKPAASPAAVDPSAQEKARAKRERRERLTKKLTTGSAEGGKWFVEHMTTLTIFLIPVYALLLRILYARSRRLYMEHLVFMLHLQAFSFLVSLPILLLTNDFMSWSMLLNVTVDAVYMFFALRRVYRQGPWKTIVKVALLLMGEFLAAAIAGMIIVLVFILRA